MIIYLDSVQKQCRETMENGTKNTIYRNFLSEDSILSQKIWAKPTSPKHFVDMPRYLVDSIISDCILHCLVEL